MNDPNNDAAPAGGTSGGNGADARPYRREHTDKYAEAALRDRIARLAEHYERGRS